MLKNKVALITGASRGIGRAIALTLSKYGAGVVINYLDRDSDADLVVREILDNGGSAIGMQADVADAQGVSSLIDRVISHYGRMDILVNNAGAIVQPSNWQDITEPTWDRTFDVHLKGTLNCIRASVPHLLKSADPSIISITSTFGAIIGAPDVIAYAAAKAAILSLTRSFAKALAPHIRVNCIAPGIVDTDMTSSAPAEFIQQQIESTPLKRMGSPNDIADTALYLASPLSRFVTGQMIVVDGGHSLR